MVKSFDEFEDGCIPFLMHWQIQEWRSVRTYASLLGNPASATVARVC